MALSVLDALYSAEASPRSPPLHPDRRDTRRAACICVDNSWIFPSAGFLQGMQPSLQGILFSCAAVGNRRILTRLEQAMNLYGGGYSTNPSTASFRTWLI